MARLARTESEFEHADRRVRQLLKVQNATRYDLGNTLIQIRDGGGLGIAGFKSFAQYLGALAAAEGVAPRTLQSHVAFAAAVPKDVALAYHADWISYALELLPPDKLGNVVISMSELHRVKLPIERDGKKLLVPIAKATVQELQAAYLEKHGLALPAASLDRDVEHVSKRLGAGIEVTPRRRKKTTGLGIFVPADKVAEFLRKLK